VPGQLGGTGHRIPASWLGGFRPRLPWWLAGGVGPASVGELLEKLRPDGLDASSAVEDRPGVKNLERVAQLVAAVRAGAAAAG
jgi:phosphoribosylanthranilate isomerase